MILPFLFFFFLKIRLNLRAWMTKVLRSDFLGLRTSEATLNSSDSVASLALPTSAALINQRFSRWLDHPWHPYCQRLLRQADVTFWKLVYKTQLSKPLEATGHYNSTKWFILLPGRAICFHSFQYETPYPVLHYGTDLSIFSPKVCVKSWDLKFFVRFVKILILKLFFSGFLPIIMFSENHQWLGNIHFTLIFLQ